MKKAALIIAREGSKRLPGKNMVEFEGKPMFAWNILKAQKFFKTVYFSSDSAAMLEKAAELGAVTIKRPPELAADDVPSIPVFQHAYQFMDDPDILVSLQPNSPTLPEYQIERALTIMNIPDIQELITVDKSLKVHGSIWALKKERLFNYGDPFVFKAEIYMSDDTVDIHTAEDLKKAKEQYESLVSS